MYDCPKKAINLLIILEIHFQTGVTSNEKSELTPSSKRLKMSSEGGDVKGLLYA